MSTPTGFRFSAVPVPPLEALERTRSLRDLHQSKPRSIARMSWNHESQEIEFLEDTITPLSNERDVPGLIRGWDGFAISYGVISIRAIIYFYFWQQPEGTVLMVEVGDKVPYIRTEAMLEGEWLERFICEYTSRCGARACAHGQGWSEALAPLDITWFTSELKEGRLLKRPQPGFYLFSEGIINEQGIQEILSSQSLDWPLRYFRSPYGQHVFSSLCAQCKGAWK